VEAIPQSCIQVQIGLSIVLYMRSLVLVESCDIRPSSQYILVRVIPSWFPFCENVLVPGKSPVKVQPEIFYISLHVVNVTFTDLDLLAFILHFLNQYWIAARLVGLQCKLGIIMALGHFLGVRQH
jgi:hypothetical protein